MLQQKTRTFHENPENYRAIPCFRDSLKYGMVKDFQNFPSFSCITFLNVCKDGVVSHVLHQETRTFNENSESYGAIPCVRDFVSHDRI